MGCKYPYTKHLQKPQPDTGNWTMRSVPASMPFCPGDRAAVDATKEVKTTLVAAGTQFDPNDTAVAGHAFAADAILVTNIERVQGLVLKE